MFELKPLHQCFDDIETAERLYYNGLLSFSAFNTINEYNNRLASVLIDRLVEAFATLHYPNIDLREAFANLHYPNIDLREAL